MDNLSENTIDEFTPRLTTADWGQEWKDLQKARHASDNSAHWDARAKSYGCGKRSPYTEQFLSFAGIRPHETVLDMGCGTGAIALPLGAMGHRVIAADFSQGMLGVLKDEAARRDITTIETKLVSWEGDWDANGIGENCVDVAVSSRSISTADMRDSLKRLSRAARRRACVTLPTSSSPRADERILTAIGLQSYLGRDYLYAFMILVELGYHPEVRYISSARLDTFDSAEKAYVSLSKMVDDACGTRVNASRKASALENLRAWIDENLVENELAGSADGNGGTQKRFKLKEPRVIAWGFIAWDV